MRTSDVSPGASIPECNGNNQPDDKVTRLVVPPPCIGFENWPISLFDRVTISPFPPVRVSPFPALPTHIITSQESFPRSHFCLSLEERIYNRDHPDVA